jgi:hypothetical protein
VNDIRVLFTAAPGFIMWSNGSARVDTSVPPVALYTLGAVVEQAGFPCTILDPVEYWRLCRDSAPLRRLAGARVGGKANCSGVGLASRAIWRA